MKKDERRYVPDERSFSSIMRSWGNPSSEQHRELRPPRVGPLARLLIVRGGVVIIIAAIGLQFGAHRLGEFCFVGRHQSLLHGRLILLKIVRRDSCIEQEIGRVHSDRRRKPDSREIIQRGAAVPKIQRTPLRQQKHLMKHVEKLARRLVDRHQDRPAAAFREIQQSRDYRLGRGRVQTGRWLVEKQQAGVDQQLLPDTHSLPLPTRHASFVGPTDQAVPAPVQAQSSHHGLGVLYLAAEEGGVDERFLDGEVGVEIVILRDEPRGAPDGVGEQAAVVSDGAARGEAAAEGGQEGRLAAA
ncbi:cyclopropane-fatty-acyl-phospholipid synthase [Striga asiatica]|uniref:Cyclopropane-fatty-acyl-phospholipid synthase n=1 Tax=Striga asiatica TaxID=4170 RepID=A0A5A7QGL0_STRAF|nr:cyclopropane-fatty-acyl-phospholipid synthase [Striga asiatica]